MAQDEVYATIKIAGKPLTSKEIARCLNTNPSKIPHQANQLTRCGLLEMRFTGNKREMCWLIPSTKKRSKKQHKARGR